VIDVSGSHVRQDMFRLTSIHGFTEETQAKMRCISYSRTEKWRELAQKTPECGDAQHRCNLETRQRIEIGRVISPYGAPAQTGE
jgi:hypothetical protein